jgi:hypothetical protein
MEKEYYRIEELTPIIKLTTEEIIETIARHKLKINKFINGNYCFSQAAIKEVESAYWGQHKRLRKKTEPKVKSEPVIKKENKVQTYTSALYKQIRRQRIAAEKNKNKKEAASDKRILAKQQARIRRTRWYPKIQTRTLGDLNPDLLRDRQPSWCRRGLQIKRRG